MTQEECLTSPHHITYLSVCYPWSVAYIGLSSADHPQPATFSVTSVPEPATSALFVLARLVGVTSLLMRARVGLARLTIPAFS
jgi:hypothetical protein